MEKGEPLAELEAGGGAICQGKASAEPIPQFCCGNLPKQASACAPRQGGAWLDGGRKQPSTTAIPRKSTAQGASLTQAAHPPYSWDPGPASSCLEPHAAHSAQGQSPRNRQAVPSPGFLEALPFHPCLLFLKLSYQTLSHTFPPSGRRGCPPTGRLLWSRATQAGSQDGRLLGTCWLEKRPPYHGHPGPDPHWAVSPTCTLSTSLQLLCKPHSRAGPWLQRLGEERSLGWRLFSPFGDHRAIASLVTSLCFHFLGTN